MPKKRAIILGAGPTGLITAWKLLEANWDVTIIEKKNASGAENRQKCGGCLVRMIFVYHPVGAGRHYTKWILACICLIQSCWDGFRPIGHAKTPQGIY